MGIKLPVSTRSMSKGTQRNHDTVPFKGHPKGDVWRGAALLTIVLDYCWS